MIIWAKEYERSLGNRIRNLKMAQCVRELNTGLGTQEVFTNENFFPSSVSKTPNTQGKEGWNKEIVQELTQLKDQLSE